MSNQDLVSDQEIEDIAKAIELSLRETSNQPRVESRLYPSTDITNIVVTTTDTAVSSLSGPRKVRALYDFEAAEDNELSFKAGEIIHIIDDSDVNWWNGFGIKGEGLFPSNFVTADLTVEPEQLKREEQLNKSAREKKTDEPKEVKIDEVKVDRLLQLLLEADPEEETDSEDLLNLELEVNGMSTLVNQELEKVDRNHARLTQLSSDLVEALNLYHTLMKESYAANSYRHNY